MKFANRFCSVFVAHFVYGDICIMIDGFRNITGPGKNRVDLPFSFYNFRVFFHFVRSR